MSTREEPTQQGDHPSGGLEALIGARRETILERAAAQIETSAPTYRRAGTEQLDGRLAVLIDAVLEAVRTESLTATVDYARALAAARFDNGYPLVDLQIAFSTVETILWDEICTRLPVSEHVGALGLMTTIFGACKDTVAREYVARATSTHSPAVDLQALSGGLQSG